MQNNNNSRQITLSDEQAKLRREKAQPDNNNRRPLTLYEYQCKMRREKAKQDKEDARLQRQEKYAGHSAIGRYIAGFDGGDWFFWSCMAMILIATGVLKVVMLAFGLLAHIWMHVIDRV